MKILSKIKYVLVLAFPSVAFAQLAYDVKSILRAAMDFLNKQLIPMTITLALIYALYAGIKFIRSGSESGDQEDAKQQLMWAIIGLFVIVSVWGLVAFVSKSLNVGVGGTLRPR